MRIAGLRDRAAGTLGAARMLRRNQTHVGHQPASRQKASRVPQFGGNGQRGDVVHAPEASQPLDARPQGLERHELLQLRFDGTEAGDRLVVQPDRRWQLTLRMDF